MKFWACRDEENSCTAALFIATNKRNIALLGRLLVLFPYIFVIRPRICVEEIIWTHTSITLCDLFLRSLHYCVHLEMPIDVYFNGLSDSNSQIAPWAMFFSLHQHHLTYNLIYIFPSSDFYLWRWTQTYVVANTLGIYFCLFK